MDLLSDICSSLRLRAELYFRAELDAPFAVALPEEAEHIRFHCLLEGVATVSVPGAAPVTLAAGDLVLVPGGAAQTLSSGDEGPATALDTILAQVPVVDGCLRVGSGDPDCRILCGYLGFDPTLRHPLLSVLPKVIVIRRDDAVCGSALRLLRDEAGQAGGSASFVLHRVVEILLIQSLRRAAAETSDHPFMAALNDPHLSRCLSAIHADPGRDWSVASLARQAGLSRSILSARFATHLNMGPSAYLTLWRMGRARELLADTALPIEDIAERCGYASLPAFSRRFAATFGMGPGQWRRQAGRGVRRVPAVSSLNDSGNPTVKLG